MVILKDLPPLNEGLYLQVLDPSDPNVLTMFIDHVLEGSRTFSFPEVHYPEDEREAWTFDLDAIKEGQPEIAGAFPPWASGKISVEPTPAGSMWRFDITPEMLGSG